MNPPRKSLRPRDTGRRGNPCEGGLLECLLNAVNDTIESLVTSILLLIKGSEVALQISATSSIEQSVLLSEINDS